MSTAGLSPLSTPDSILIRYVNLERMKCHHLLGHKILQVFPLPSCVHLPLPPHPLKRIAEALLWPEVDTDFLDTEAFGMLPDPSLTVDGTWE